MTKRKRKLKKRALFIIISIIICILLYILIFHSSVVISIIKKTETTCKFDYTLEKRDTDLMKENFKELDNVLCDDQIDYKKYADFLSKLFIIDLYTIDNKKNMYDVGSLEYVYDKDYSNVIIEQLLYYSNGTIMNGLNSTILKNVSIAIPDINEQLQIVNYLKKKTQEIDNLIDSKSKIIEELEQYKKSLIYEYVTGKKEVV